MEQTPQHGWHPLANGFTVQFEHAIPTRISSEGRPVPTDAAAIEDEIAVLSGLRARIGAWQSGERADEREAPLTIQADDIDRVLRRLAGVSAAVYYDRFQKPLDDDDPDWDVECYAQDFASALSYCGLGWNQANKDDYWPTYRAAMHEETVRLAALGEVDTPPE